MISTILLRGFSMLGKFLLIFVMAASMSTNSIAEYGSLTSFIVMATYITGFDFYIGYSRLGTTKEKNKFNLIRLLTNLIFSIPIFIFLIFFSELIGQTQIFIYIAIYIFSFIAQEFYRILIADGKFVTSNVVFFLRSGLWCFISATFIYYTNHDSIYYLKFILLSWLISEALCCMVFAIYLFFLNSEYLKIKSFTLFMYKDVIKNQLIIFSSSLCILMINSFDKFFLNAYTDDKDFVSAYYLNSIVANSILIIIYTSLINPRFRNFTTSHFTDKQKNEVMRQFSIQCLTVGFLFSAAFYLLFDQLTNFLGRSYLEDNSFLKLPFTILIILNVINLIPHYYLFIHRKDRDIANISIFTVFFILIMMFFLPTYLGSMGVLVSLIIGMVFMILYKAIKVTRLDEFKLS